MTTSPTLIVELSPKKRALLDAWRRRQGFDPVAEQRIPRRNSDSSIPLSFAQQRLWFLEQLDPGTALYNVPMAYRFRGVLDKGALRDALVERGWKLFDDLQYLEVQGADHTEAAWAARVDPALRYLFPPAPLPRR